MNDLPFRLHSVIDNEGGIMNVGGGTVALNDVRT